LAPGEKLACPSLFKFPLYPAVEESHGGKQKGRRCYMTEDDNPNLTTDEKDLAIQRYESLGEMNPQVFWETTLDPEKRSLSQVKIEDAMKADELYTALMGEQLESRSVRAVIDELNGIMRAVRVDIKEIKRDLKDLTRSFNTLAGDGAKLRAAYDELE